MTIKKFSLFLALLIGLAGTISCNKKKAPYAQAGQTEANVVFMNPTQGISVNNSTEVSVEARIDADAMMSGYRIIFSHGETGEVIKSLEDLYEQTQYLVHYHWFPEFDQSTPVTITVEALAKNNEVLASGSTYITCTP